MSWRIIQRHLSRIQQTLGSSRTLQAMAREHVWVQMETGLHRETGAAVTLHGRLLPACHEMERRSFMRVGTSPRHQLPVASKQNNTADATKPAPPKVNPNEIVQVATLA